MEPKKSYSLSPQTQVILTLLVAIVIILILGLIFIANRSDQPQVETANSDLLEDWPTPKPSATATMAGPLPATLAPTATPTPSPSPTPTPTPTPIVIGSFQELGNLISVEYTLQTVVETQRERVFPLGPERIILVAVGNIEAGIDLTQIEDSDIIIEGTSVTIMLPPAQVTSIELLPGETEIFDSQRGWLMSEYEGLELEAMDKARSQLEHWAIDRVNILDQAEESAETQMENFLRRLGFKDIQILYKR